MIGYSSDNKELTPIAYQKSAIKISDFSKMPGQECFRIHWHERLEFLRMRSGEMQMTCGTGTFVLQPGEMAIVPSRIPHRGIATGKEMVSYEVLMFDVRSFYNSTEICQMYLPQIYDGRVLFRQKTSNGIVVSCFDEIFRKAKDDSLEVTALVYKFLDSLLKYDLLEMKKRINRDEIVSDMIAYIENNFSEDITSEMVAQHFGYTTEHFCRKFKQAVGLTPMNYLRVYRLEMACQLLKTHNYNISDIAMRCGFDDSNYFTRCFKSHFGKVPTQYLREKESNY